jgi:hypothetical protein
MGFAGGIDHPSALQPARTKSGAIDGVDFAHGRIATGHTISLAISRLPSSPLSDRRVWGRATASL